MIAIPAGILKLNLNHSGVHAITNYLVVAFFDINNIPGSSISIYYDNSLLICYNIPRADLVMLISKKWSLSVDLGRLKQK